MKNKIISTSESAGKLIKSAIQGLFNFLLANRGRRIEMPVTIGSASEDQTKKITDIRLDPWKALPASTQDKALKPILSTEKRLRVVNALINKELKSDTKPSFNKIKTELESIIRKINDLKDSENFFQHNKLIYQLFEMVDDCARRIGEKDLWVNTK